jgi:hypothetical protein
MESIGMWSGRSRIEVGSAGWPCSRKLFIYNPFCPGHLKAGAVIIRQVLRRLHAPKLLIRSLI